MIINVSKKTSATSLAYVIKKNVKPIELRCIGAASVNQVVKAIAIYKKELDISVDFINVEIEGKEKSGIKFIIKEKE